VAAPHDEKVMEAILMLRSTASFLGKKNQMRPAVGRKGKGKGKGKVGPMRPIMYPAAGTTVGQVANQVAGMTIHEVGNGHAPQ